MPLPPVLLHMQNGLDTINPNNAYRQFEAATIRAMAELGGDVTPGSTFAILDDGLHAALSSEPERAHIFLLNAATPLGQAQRGRIESMLADFPNTLVGIGVLTARAEAYTATSDWLRGLPSERPNVLVYFGDATNIDIKAVQKEIASQVTMRLEQINEAQRTGIVSF